MLFVPESAFKAMSIIADIGVMPDISELTFTRYTVQQRAGAALGTWHACGTMAVDTVHGHQTMVCVDAVEHKGDTPATVVVIDLGAYRAVWKV